MGLADPVFFCRFFLEEQFPGEMPWVHRGLLAIMLRRTEFLRGYGELDKIFSNFLDQREQPIFIELEDKSIALRLNRFTEVLLPRGFSKTTICGQAVPLHNILYLNCDFMLYLSESATHAAMQATNVRRHLSTNKRVLRVFGDLKPKISDDQKWSEQFFETLSGAALGVQGRGGQVRGMNHLGQRPKHIVADDVEDQESVRVDGQRMKAKDWLYGDVLPALPPMDESSTVTMLGTILHRDALTVTAMKDPRFTCIRFGCFDRQGDPLWAAVMDRAKYDSLKVAYQNAGLLHRFYMEYDNDIKHDDAAPFQLEYLEEFYGKAPPLDKLQCSIYCDPAISPKRGSDEAVITVFGMEDGGWLWKLDEWAAVGATPRDIVDNYFRLRAQWGRPRRNGVESNAYQAALVHLLREEMFRRHDYFEIESVLHQIKKETRIEGVLQPRYASRYIRHARPFPEHDVQLMDWPSPSKMDRVDASAGAIVLLDPYAAMAADPTKDLAADEYEPLVDFRGI